ncbi:hypothetical protein PYCCODRAFT_1396659 [Trametes coccinea BRFM310]|uniref:MYND-type domain-containing protein n=1 Tax=Trametes coccinea (strain BRFM310) TaxID=1353009 RepID=A0A1Y2IFQ4_TRAC3|nr:hypothetical protein PYCCODRAFT_1396659 [Trametes coccinea BRFM310]
MPPYPVDKMPAVSNYPQHITGMVKKWTNRIKNDPRRVCRTLLLTSPSGETVEGDTFDDAALLFDLVKEAAKKPTSRDWRGLVDAGIITSLCKWAINSQQCLMKAYMVVNDRGLAELDENSMERAKDNAPAPYTPALEVLCNAAMSCAVPPTATENKMIEELKQHWHTMVQRIWSDPSWSLEPGTDMSRVVERALLAQLVHRLTYVDSSFLDVILKPSDLTLAVVFRNWLYSTSDYDTMINCTLICPLLDGNTPNHWKRHFAEHPPPELQALLPRILLGASRGTGKKKRTPNQIAESIVSAFVNQFGRLAGRNLKDDFDFFSTLLDVGKDNVAFYRAVCQSEGLWTALFMVIVRDGLLSRNPPRGYEPDIITLQALGLYIHVGRMPAAQEHVDALVRNWLAGKILDALEVAIVPIVRHARGPMLVSSILSIIDENLPKLSAKTRKKLRAELPQPGLMMPLLQFSLRGRKEPGSILAQVLGTDEELKSAEVDVSEPTHPIWTKSAWQLLWRLTTTLRPLPGSCSARGCENPAYGGECPKCNVATYCGQECAARDDGHRILCPWMKELLWVSLCQRRPTEEMDAIRAGGVIPETPAEHVKTQEDILNGCQESGMPAEIIQRVLEIAEKNKENPLSKDEPIPGITALREAVKKVQISTAA